MKRENAAGDPDTNSGAGAGGTTDPPPAPADRKGFAVVGARRLRKGNRDAAAARFRERGLDV